MKKIAIIDYNAGNTKSVINAITRLGFEPILTSNPEIILSSDKVILPGVGHAAASMKELKNRNLIDIIEKVTVPFLGICVGMQLLVNHSEEGDTSCLGIVNGNIYKFKASGLKVPKMGWNTISINKTNQLFDGINNDSYFYFVHSYYLPMNDNSIASAKYGIDYSVAIHSKNFYGVQFHPEKSGTSGERLINNFLNL
jgi:glutamine amidotransferase